MMNLLIRSQNREDLYNLLEMDGIGISNFASFFKIIIGFKTEKYQLGVYSSKEKALKVIDEIERCYIETSQYVVYYVPADDEVEVEDEN